MILKYSPQQARVGKKLVQYFTKNGISYNEARLRTVDILDEHKPSKIMNALADRSIVYDVGNFYIRLNLKNHRNRIK